MWQSFVQSWASRGIQACLAQLMEATGVARPIWRSSLGCKFRAVQSRHGVAGCIKHNPPGTNWRGVHLVRCWMYVLLAGGASRGVAAGSHVRAKPAGAESRRTIIYLFYLFFRSLSRGFPLFALHFGPAAEKGAWIRGSQKLDAYPPPLFNLQPLISVRLCRGSSNALQGCDVEIRDADLGTRES